MFFGTIPSGYMLVFCLMSLLSIFVAGGTNLYKTGCIIGPAGCWARQVSELRRLDYVIDQLEMIYAGPGRSVNCATRT